MYGTLDRTLAKAGLLLVFAAAATGAGLLFTTSWSAVAVLFAAPVWSVFLCEIIWERQGRMRRSFYVFTIVISLLSLAAGLCSLILHNDMPQTPLEYYPYVLVPSQIIAIPVVIWRCVQPRHVDPLDFYGHI